MSLFTNISIATNALFTPVYKANYRAVSAGLMTLAVALPLAAGLAGCGGGGGAGTPADPSKEVPGSAPSSPAVTPIVTPAVTPTPDPAVVTFVPNYRSDLAAARRWDKPVVTVGFTAPVDTAGNTRNVRPLVQQAIDLWNRKISQDISFQLTDSTDADIQIRWVAPGTLPSDAIGRTEVRFRNVDQVLISASVAVEQSLPDNFQVQVLTHELGHSLGIEGHSTLQSDLMYANSHLPTEITSRDRNTVLQAYSSDAGRSAHPALSAGSTSTATSTVQYVCGSSELLKKIKRTKHAPHTKH